MSLTVLCAAAMPSMALDGTGNVASVDGQEYATVQEAINNGNGKTVTLLDDAKENVVIPEGATVTLDLGTFTLANNGASHTITNKGTLTIQGSGKVDNENHGKAALWNEGTAVLNGGTFDRSKEAGSSAEASGSNSYYTVVNHGNMTINDGVTITQNGKFSSLLENGWYNGAENKSGQPSVLTIKGGTFSGGLNTIKNDDYGELIVEGGTFTNVAPAAWPVKFPTAATAAPPLPEERLLRSRPTNISAAPARLPSTRLPAGRLPIISAKNPSIRRPRMRKAAAPLRF